jgi:toxin ParE1/3/4
VIRPVVWIPAAIADVTEAQAWYDAMRSGLGDRFTASVAAAVDAIAANPEQFPLVDSRRRRAGVRRFPYGLFFEVEEHRVVVIACFHGRRDPRRWQSR